MIDWTKNMSNIASDGNPCKCPVCGNKNTDYKYSLIDSGWGYCDIWCNECKHAYHVSRVRVPETIPDKILPDNLLF